MGWNLPPGCTDKDVDDAAPQEEEHEMAICPKCGQFYPLDEMFEVGTPTRKYLICGDCYTWQENGPEYEPE